MARIDIGDAIAKLRRHRLKFLTDTDMEAAESTAAMVDKLWPLRAAQLDSETFHLHIYEPDPNAPDQEAEQKKQLDSALLAKLAIPVWDSDLGITKSAPYDRNAAIDAIAVEMEQLARTGQYSALHEASGRINGSWKGAPASGITPETLRHNRSLSPKMREAMFAKGLEQPTSRLNAKKRRASPETSPGMTPFVRGRKEWRVKQLLTACQQVRDVAKWIADNPDDNLIPVLVERYDFAGLLGSKSKFASDDFPTRLAIAIASADHCGQGTDQYVSNADLALAISRIYGLYETAVSATAKSPSGTMSVSSKFKSLISN